MVTADAGGGRKKRPTLNDVGRLAGADASIVSRVLNGEEGRVRPATRDRIFAAASQLGYRPHPAAQALSGGRTNTIGIVSPSLTQPGYASMIDGIEVAAGELGYMVLWLHAVDDTAAVAKQIERLVDRVDGVILATARGNGEAVRALAGSNVPFLLLNRAGGDEYPSVIGDDEEGARVAGAHLISLGHTRIAHVSGPENVDTVARRRAGFVQALRAARIPCDEEELLKKTDLTEAGASQATRELITSHTPPTAIFYATITAALGGLRSLREMRVGVPDEISVITFDDSPIVEHLAVPLTTIRMPHAEMGSHAVKLLANHLETGDALTSETVAVAPELVIRYSTQRVGDRDQHKL